MATTPNAFVQHAQHATAPVPRLATIRFRMWCVQEGAGVIAWVRSPRVSSLKVVPLVEEKIGREVLVLVAREEGLDRGATWEAQRH